MTDTPTPQAQPLTAHTDDRAAYEQVIEQQKEQLRAARAETEAVRRERDELLAERERLREALEKIERGQEIRLPDGTSVVEDLDDASEVARAALAGEKEQSHEGA